MEAPFDGLLKEVNNRLSPEEILVRAGLALANVHQSHLPIVTFQAIPR